MVDFGLSSFLDKFEERFGKKATTGLLVIIALAVASVCINTFYVMAVSPVFISLILLWQSAVPNLSIYWDLLKNLTILVLVIALAISVLRNVLVARVIDRTKENIAILRTLTDVAKVQVDQLVALTIKREDKLEKLKRKLKS